MTAFLDVRGFDRKTIWTLKPPARWQTETQNFFVSAYELAKQGVSVSTNRMQSLLNVQLDEADGEVFALGSRALRPEIKFRPFAVETWQYTTLKRAMDFGAAILLAVLFLVPGLVIAGLIILTSPGSIFYREERVGWRGRPFRIWKFRSMCADAAQIGRVQHVRNGDNVLEWRMHKHLPDPRITRVGRILRSTSLDEVPQLLNVLRGEMSLVGPRPIVMAELCRYGDLVGYYLSATPGMSGLWQVSGRSDLDYAKRAQLDMQYVESWSLFNDLMILFRTIPAVLRRAGAR